MGIKQISPKELDLKKGMVLLDVCTDKEYERGIFRARSTCRYRRSATR
jgi:hypothetical protein